MENNHLFKTDKNRIFQIWDEVQKIQTDLCFPLEIASYYSSGFQGEKISDILDAGTGNGYYLGKLHDFFQDKQFLGIDTSKELIDTAKKQVEKENIQFAVQDFFSVQKQYDFVITRLFWQHLNHTQVKEALVKLKDITRPGGSVIVMDALDEKRLFYPPLPEFETVIAEYAKKKLVKEQRDRGVVKTIHNWVRQEDQWTIGLDMSIVIPSTIPGNMYLFQRIYNLWLDLFEAAGELDFDLSPARKELQSWKTQIHTYSQVGMRILRLDYMK